MGSKVVVVEGVEASEVALPRHDAQATDESEEGRKSLWQRTILDPRTNSFVAYWDLVATMALVFTALVTPVEVAFLEPPPPELRWVSGLFLTNRCVDLIFIIDMLLQFRMAYKMEDVREGTRWVVEGRAIALHYMCGFWFPLDFFSVSTLLFDVLDNEDTKDLTALRAVRTLRLVKLVKLARGSRILKRWEMHVSINYSHLSLFTVVILILISCHWTACIWGLQAMFDPLNSWPGAKEYCVPWGDTNYTRALQMLEDPVHCPPGDVCTLGKCDVGERTCEGDGLRCEHPFESK